MKRCLPFLVVLVTSFAYGSPPPDQQPVREIVPGGERGISDRERGISDRLRNELATRAPDEMLKVWVYLADKGLDAGAGYAAALAAAEDRLTPRARRRLSTRSDQLAGWEDIPVHAPYLERIEASGGRILQVSRWLNAASVSIPAGDIDGLAGQPFVLSIDAVASLSHPRPLPPRTSGQPELDARLRAVRSTRLDYGPSFVQMNQLHVPELHNLGLSGKGVLVALFDTGFSLDHAAFDSLRTRVEARRNFLRDETGFTGLEDIGHGTAVLGTIGGYAPGELIGPAFGARFLLASTEVVAFEREIEEDFWVAAIEWADSLGADVVSSSLGYLDWYTYADMDGESAVITQAATMAVRRGIVVVNSMGNEGDTPYQKMAAPADAKEVISVGAVDATGRRAAFSSIGPTFDGRIKPDVMAMGEGTYTVHPFIIDEYLRLNGTSFSAPLVAGVAALLLEAYPHWTPEKVQSVLRQTAGQAAAPDTLNGYGIVHALNALMTESRGVVRSFTAEAGLGGVSLSWTAGLEINLQSYRIERRAYPDGSFEVLTSVPVTRSGEHSQGSSTYDYTDASAQPGTSYEYRLQPEGRSGLALTAEPVVIRFDYATGTPGGLAAVLYPNAPNPFASSTRIRFELSEPVHVTLTIYNLLGRKIRVLVDETHGPGRYAPTWNGMDGDGRAAPSGVYLYRMTAGGIEQNGKMLLLR
ncbi:MAG: S8 family serine peptidase [Gemmatimonadetes bacterium]|nr:S8 family serine peptidase [Gemmatimonadota bacterium]